MNQKKSRLSVVAVLPIESLSDLINQNPELADQTNRNSIQHTAKEIHLEGVKMEKDMQISSSLEIDLNQE